MSSTSVCAVSLGGKWLPNIYGLGFYIGQSIVSLIIGSNSNPDNGVNGTASSLLSSPSSGLKAVFEFPALYKEWWINLYSNDPTHVYVETTLIIAIIFFLVSRKRGEYYWRDRVAKAEKLSLAEEEELLQEWKERIRQPLASSSSSNSNTQKQHNPAQSPNLIVHKNNSRLMEIQINNSNDRKTVLNFATFDFLGMASEDPIALASKISSTRTNDDNDDNNNTIDKSNENHAKVIQSPESYETIANPVKQAALAALDRYGCGSCGPRGFYGTVDVHLQLESTFAKFMKTDAAILYSDASSTVSSTIAAFCKRGDLLVVDDACYEPIVTGVLLSRANIVWFKHNDMNDLRAVMAKAHEADVKLGRKPNAQRRFVVVEGLYKNTGSICPLNEIVELKNKYHYRVILDESHSFGTLGHTGKGVTELYGKELMKDVEIVTVSIENSLGSIGGMTIGTDEIVDHQRLCGAGYCFSASSPPFTAAAAMEALKVIDTNSSGLISRLNWNRDYMYEQLSNMLANDMDDLLLITSDKRSPIIMLQLAPNVPETRLLNENVFLHQIVNESLLSGEVAFVATGPVLKETDSLTKSTPNNSKQIAKSKPGSSSNGDVLSNDPPPRLRIAVTAAHTQQDIDHAIAVLRDSIDVVMNRCLSSYDGGDEESTINNADQN